MRIVRRRPHFDFSIDVERHWFGNRPFVSYFLASYALLFPDGEQFIIRTCRKFMSQTSTSLKADIQDFIFQESQHSRQHRMALDVFRRQGYDIDKYLARINFFTYKLLEPRTPAVVALAACSAIEQLNVALSTHFLDESTFTSFEDGDDLGDLLLWHFCEELEHRTVVFDLHNEVHQGSRVRSLGLRALGMYMAWTNFVPLLIAGSFYLGHHDHNLRRPVFWKDLFQFVFRDGTAKALIRHSFAYLRPSFDAESCVSNDLIVENLARIRSGFDS